MSNKLDPVKAYKRSLNSNDDRAKYADFWDRVFGDKKEDMTLVTKTKQKRKRVGKHVS